MPLKKSAEKYRKSRKGTITKMEWRNRNRGKIRKWKREWASSLNGKASQRKYRSKSSKALFHLYRASAERRKIDFDISEKCFSEIIQNNCVYCGQESKVKRNGIDRIDNKQGYVKGNLSPCCFRCNQMKGKLSVSEFINHIRRVIKYAA